MAAHDYAFLTRWRVDGPPEDPYDVIADPEALPCWWPSVYLRVAVVSPPGAEPRVVELHTKGFLPYTLRWRFQTTERVRPRRIALEARGDFEGRGIWTFTPRDGGTDIDFDWRLRAEKPLLRRLSFLMKPLFSANHRWAMARGEESLVLELRRRRATSDAERAMIPPPPGPTFPHNLRRA